MLNLCCFNDHHLHNMNVKQLFCHFLVIISLGLLSCGKDLNVSDSRKLSFYVENFKILTIPDSFGSNFIFSPIDNQDVIWILGSNTGGAVNLRSGKVNSIDEVFKFNYKGGISMVSNWHDSVTGDVYMDVAFGKLIRYNAKSKSFYKVNISDVSGVVGTKDRVYISTSKGLFTFERDNESLKYLYTNLNRNDIESITKVNDGLILIQTQSEISYHYNVNKKSLMVIENCETVQNNNVYQTHQVLQILPNDLYNNNRIIKDDSLTWIYTNDKLLFTYDDLNIYETSILPKENILQIQSDGKYLYILFRNKFIIYRKSFLISTKSLYFVGNPNATRDRLKYITSQLNTTFDLDTFFHYMNILESEIGFKKYEDVDQLISGYKGRLLSVQYDSSFRNKTEYYLKENLFPEKYSQQALEGLISHFVQDEKFGETKKYIKIYIDKFSIDSNYHIRHTFPCYLRCIKSLDSLLNADIAPDEKLYKTALVKDQLVNCGGFGESYIDNTIALDCYKKIVKLYPSSEYADEAAYYLTLYATFIGYDGVEYSEESINEFRKFIKNYPTSDKVVDAELLIIEIYMAFYGLPDEVNMMYKKAEKEITKLEGNHKLNTNQKQNLINIKSNLGQYIMENTYEFEVKPQKEEFKIGEDITIDVSLTNLLSKKVELQIFKNIVPFNIAVTFNGKENFVKSSKTDNEKTNLILKGNETKTWKLNLSKETRSIMNATNVGKYNLTKPGKYYISLYGIDMNFNSNQSQFIIK